MAGYWKGTATQQGSNRTFDTVALIDAQGNAQWVLLRAGLLEDDGFVVSANVCCESQFDDDAIGKELGETRTHDASISVEVDGGVLSGELQFRRDDYQLHAECSRRTTTEAFRSPRSPACTRAARARYSASKSR